MAADLFENIVASLDRQYASEKVHKVEHSWHDQQFLVAQDRAHYLVDRVVRLQDRYESVRMERKLD